MKLLYVLLFVPVLVLAQDVAAAVPSDVPEWLAGIMHFGESLPYVGPLLVGAMKWAGFLAAVLTAVAVCLEAIKVAVVQSFKAIGFEGAANKIEAAINKILPYVKYLSMLNVQKK